MENYFSYDSSSLPESSSEEDDYVNGTFDKDDDYLMNEPIDYTISNQTNCSIALLFFNPSMFITHTNPLHQHDDSSLIQKIITQISSLITTKDFINLAFVQHNQSCIISDELRNLIVNNHLSTYIFVLGSELSNTCFTADMLSEFLSPQLIRRSFRVSSCELLAILAQSKTLTLEIGTSHVSEALINSFSYDDHWTRPTPGKYVKLIFSYPCGQDFVEATFPLQ